MGSQLLPSEFLVGIEAPHEPWTDALTSLEQTTHLSLWYRLNLCQQASTHVGSDAFMIMGYHSVLGCYEKRKRKIKKSKRPKTKTHLIIMVSHEQNGVVTYVLSPLLYSCTMIHLGDPYLTKEPQLLRHHFSIYCMRLFQGNILICFPGTSFGKILFQNKSRTSHARNCSHVHL